MRGLYDIPSITPQAADLLEAAGFALPEDIAAQDPVLLHGRLVAINQQLQILTPEPNLLMVTRWIDGAKWLRGELSTPRPAPAALPTNLDDIPEVIVVEPAASASKAEEINRPARKNPEFGGLVATPVAPSAPPVVPKAEPNAARPQPAGPGQYKAVPLRPALTAARDPRRVNPKAEVWKNIEPSRFQTFDNYATGESGIKPLKRFEEDEQPAQDMQRVKVGEGGKVPRRVKRGVEHPNPGRVHFAAFVTIVQRLLMIAVIIGTPLALIYGHMTGVPDTLPWYEKPIGRFLPVIALWLIFTLLFFIIAWRMRCRICTCKLFQAIRTHKHMKSHQLLFFGYVVSLAIHALLFGWFRCMYCGTAIRIRR